MNHCAAGHHHHETKRVPTAQGEMTIFDWEKYQGFAGYCPGQDDVSMTLDKYGVWDLEQSEMLEYLCDSEKEGVVIDVGAHIGYFSRLASNCRRIVYSYEGETEMNRLLAINAPKAAHHNIWFDENCGENPSLTKIVVIKIDIEGNERFAINYFKKPIEAGLVDNILMEVSPCFNSGYPILIKYLVDVGYNVKEMDGQEFDYEYNFDQKDLWLHL